MTFRLLSLLAILCGAAALPADDAPGVFFPFAPQTTEITITDDSGKPVSVKVVPREQLRVKTNKRFKVMADASTIPAPPAEFDWTKDKSGKKIPLPLHGNDRYGNCYYVAPCHVIESQLAQIGTPKTFADADIVRAYLRLSPRDQGLADEDIIPEWTGGLIGGRGPYKLLDYALVSPTDWKSFTTAMYYLGGCVSTHTLRTPWEAVNGSGFVWDATGSIDPNAGHAIGQHGVKSGNSILSTWGMTGYMTPRGMSNSDAEIVVGVSTAWFDSRGYTPLGDHYDDVSAYWKSATGKTLPIGLFPPKEPTPVPPKPPAPPVVEGITGTETIVYIDGSVVSKTWTPGKGILPVAPNVNADTHTIDLEPLLGHILLERRKERVRARIINHLTDNDHADLRVDGDKLTFTRKAGVDPGKWIDFLTKLLPLILQIIAMFGA